MLVPYNVAFNSYEEFFLKNETPNKWQKMSWLIIDSMVDVIFIADVVINFMTSIRVQELSESARKNAC
jgi:hypothetical protein